MLIRWFVDSVRLAPSETVMMSKKHCHARHVSSIVVGSNKGMLLRAFLAWPDHRLENNRIDGDLVLGVHDHRYDLGLFRLHGEVEHTTFVECPGDSFYKWSFSSGVQSGKPQSQMVGKSGLRIQTHCALSDHWLKISSDVLHDVSCTGVCGWMVQEGAVVNDRTTLFTAVDHVDTDGLYERFESREEVIDHVERWASLALGVKRAIAIVGS